MTFKFIQGNIDPHMCNMVVHRGVIVSRNLEPTGYNYALAPKSDAYLPEVYLECGTPSKPTTTKQQETMNPPNIALAEGEGGGQALEFNFSHWC